MKRSSVRSGGLMLASMGLVAAVGWAWTRLEARALQAELQAVHSEAAELRQLRAESERLRSRTASAEQVKALREEQAEAARLRVEIAELKQRATAAPHSATTRSLSDGIDEQYAAVFGELNLDAGQAKRLRALLIHRAQARMDVVDAARRDGRDPNGQSTREEAARARMAVEWQIRHELGELRYAAFQEFEWTLSARGVVKQAETMLARTPTPLKPEQAAELMPILARARGGDVFDPVRPEAYRIRLDDEAIRAAAAVLTAEQMRVLEFIRKGMERSWQ